MRVLCIEDTPDGLLDLAVIAKRLGHSERYYCRAYDAVRCPVGRGLVERVPDWRASMRWADLVVVGGNGKWLRELDAWRAQGVPLIGGCAEAAALELDRLAGMAAFKRAGVPIPPFRQCANLKEAMAYIESRGEGCAVKPCGDIGDKSTSVVSKNPDAILWRLGRWQKEGKHFPAGVIVQDRIDGVEFAVGGWIGPDGFAPGWEQNWEEKALCAGGHGPACYSADTEVLTEAGWKFWPDVTGSDRIATLVNGYMQYEKPSRLVAAPFDGEMIAWQSNRIDILVTPGHQMYVADRNTVRIGEPEFEHLPAHVVAANAVDKKHAVLRTANWAGERFPSGPAYARLYGMFMADGYCRRRSIVFGNCPKHKEALIRAAAMAVGLTAHRYGPDVYINSSDLANAWAYHPKAPEKRAPREIMDATVDVIAAFLDGLSLDATTKAGNLTYTTASRGMADDIQIMLIRTGFGGDVRERDRRGDADRKIAGYTIKGSLSWEIGVSSNALAWLRPRYCRRVPYNGMVYCATVSSHVMLVRRNGKACWNGNTGEMGTTMVLSRASKMADKVLAPFEDMLVRMGYVGNVDVNCIVDEEGTPWPLEWTTRLGWPAFNIECALHADPVEFLAGLAAGKPPNTRRLNEVAVGVVLPIPPFPHGHEKTEEVVGVPIWGITPAIEDRVHLAQAIIEKGQLATAGSYPLICTGTGDTVSQARAAAYRVVDRVEIPVKTVHRLDIGARLARQIPQLQEHGFAKGLVYSA